MLINVLPLAVYFLLLARLVERYGRTDWGRLFVLAAACSGRSDDVCRDAEQPPDRRGQRGRGGFARRWPIWQGEDRRWRSFALAGFFAAFTAANELPALSFTVAAGRGLVLVLPAAHAAGVPARGGGRGGSRVHHELPGPRDLAPALRPPPQRTLLTTVPGSFDTSALDQRAIPDPLRRNWPRPNWRCPPQADAHAPHGARRLDAVGPAAAGAAGRVARGGGLDVHAWDNWYEFPGSYWTGDARTGRRSGRTLAAGLRLPGAAGASRRVLADADLAAERRRAGSGG